MFTIDFDKYSVEDMKIVNEKNNGQGIGSCPHANELINEGYIPYGSPFSYKKQAETTLSFSQLFIKLVKK